MAWNPTVQGYEVICERCRDNQRFKRVFQAGSEQEAIDLANRLLWAEQADYYVISAERR
jgi:hypothetical protein